MLELQKTPKSRLPLFLAGSIALHLGLVGLLYGSWMWGVASKFGSIAWDDAGEARHKVVKLDRTKPLYMPDGFYAVEKPPEEVAERDERPKTDKKEPEEKKDEKKDGEDTEETPEETPEPEQPKEPEQPAGSNKFGTIRGGALKPHIVQAYSAYEQGLIDVRTFTVTVTTKAEPDGSLSNIKVVKSSGSEIIDKTAINLFKELSDMNALAPLSSLSSLSLTLEVGASSSSITAVGFARDAGESQELANQLGLIAFGAKFKARTPDEKALIENVRISHSGNRVSVSLGLPNSRAADMMKRSFGGSETAKT